MLKKTIKYVDFEGNEREEVFHFNFTKAELTEMALSVDGGLEKQIHKIIAEQDMPKIIELFKRMILDSYGEKSPDGKRFVKSKELRDSFEQTEAYSTLFMELVNDAVAASAFVNAITPQVK